MTNMKSSSPLRELKYLCLCGNSCKGIDILYFFGLFFIFFFNRVLGSLLSAHLIIKDPLQPFGDMVPLDYDNELLLLAHDIANRLMAAFETATKIPYPRVSRCDYHSNLITP